MRAFEKLPPKFQNDEVALLRYYCQKVFFSCIKKDYGYYLLPYYSGYSYNTDCGYCRNS